MEPAAKFDRLADLYDAAKPMLAAVCAVKGGLDCDNYAGRIFVNDVLELAVAVGEKLGGEGARLEKLKKEFAKVADDTTPSSKPIHEMSMEEFLRLVPMGEK
ncbi:MAG: hypothetical protein LBG89_00235 [Rickettsiales bacterium]|jgi:hypothetical protein|nr:hypothetical protein [Rickettsiales bacterium]